MPTKSQLFEFFNEHLELFVVTFMTLVALGFYAFMQNTFVENIVFMVLGSLVTLIKGKLTNGQTGRVS